MEPEPHGLAALRVDARSRRIAAVTLEASAALGLDAAALVGTPLSELWAPRERAAIGARFDDVVLLGCDRFGALSLAQAVGRPLWAVVDAAYRYRDGESIELQLEILAPPRGRAVADEAGAGPEPRGYPPVDEDDHLVLATLEAAGAAALSVAPDGSVTAVTSAAGRLLDAAVAALRGRSLAHLVTMSAPAAEALAAARATGMRQTVRARGPSGSGLIVDWVPVRSTGAGFAVLTVGGAEHGDTDRIKLQAQVASHLAHDLRRDLGGVESSLQLIDEDLPEGDPLHQEVARGLARCGKLRHMIEDVLAASRSASVERLPIDVGELVEDTLSGFASRAAEQSVAIEARIATGLIVRGDAMELGRAIGNLIDNALTFTPAGGRIVVEVAPEERAGPGVRVSVSDTGPGVDPEIRSRIFEPSVTGRRGGTGLGLWIARRVAVWHGGQIDVHSAGDRDRQGAGNGSGRAAAVPDGHVDDAGAGTDAGGGTGAGDDIGATFDIWLPLAGEANP